jgi:hypothetical protein
MNTLCQIETGAHRKKASGLREKMVPSKVRIHLLSVGSLDRSFVLHDNLLEAPSCHLSVAWNCLEIWMIADYRELWIIPRREAIQLAILHDTLSSFELDEAARLIRCHWPSAGILLISTEEDFLNHAMYDDRIAPDASPGVYLTAIDHLLQRRRE